MDRLPGRKDAAMPTVEEKLAKSLSADSTELIPYLPYLLQDLWDLGSSPGDMLKLIAKHVRTSGDTIVLDLACGRGAVSVHLARELGCRVKGIDITPSFIEYARTKAREYGVEEQCEFVLGDITSAVCLENGYDITILGAVGDVLGNVEETITLLRGTVKTGCHLLIDDAFGKGGSDSDYLSRDQWVAVFERTGVRLVDECFVADKDLVDLNSRQQAWIAQRARELKCRFPEKADLFDGYIESQRTECDELEIEITGVTMLLQVL